MFVFYTILYFFILYMGPTLKSFVPGLMPFVGLLREGYLIYIFFMFFLQKTKTPVLKCNKENCLLMSCMVLALPYIFISYNFTSAVLTYHLFFSGPLLFILISNLTFSKKTLQHYNFWIRFIFGIVCVSSAAFFFVQDKILSVVDPELLTAFYKQSGNGVKLRLTGIGFHPTTTAYMFVYFAALEFFFYRNKIKSVILLFFSYLTSARSVFLGAFVYIFTKISKMMKIVLILLGFVFMFIIVKMLISLTLYKYLDPSAAVHLFDLFIGGPKWVLSSLLGRGLGIVSPYNMSNPIVHIESDLYVYAIQMNILNLILFILAIITIIKQLNKTHCTSDNYYIFILLTFSMGCFVFGLHAIRFTTNFVWIELGIRFSNKERIEKE